MTTCEPAASKEAKLAQVMQWILAGETAHHVKEAIAKFYPTEEPTALILEVMVGFEKAANFNPAVVQGWCFEAYRDLYRRMVFIGDFAGALRAVRMIEDLARRSSHVHDDIPGPDQPIALDQAEPVADGIPATQGKSTPKKRKASRRGPGHRPNSADQKPAPP